jgi:hypothetical protein
MAKADRLRATPQPESGAGEPPTWAEAYAELDVCVIAIDRLALFAGDGEEGPEAPDSVRQDPALLLAWCERYAPQMVLDDESALVHARNRTMADVVRRLRRHAPKVRVTPADVKAFLAEAEPR